LGLSGFVFSVPVTRTDTGNEQNGNIGCSQRGAAECPLDPDGQRLQQAWRPGGFSALDSTPNRFLEAGRQLSLRLPGSEKLA